MLEASLERRYSASPAETFFTGGGMHTFGNFDREDDRKVMTIREAFQNSVNLVFIRLMRDVVTNHLYGAESSLAVRLADPARPAPRSLPEPLRGPGGQRVRPALLPEVPGPRPRRPARRWC